MTLFKYATPIPFTDLGKLEIGLTDLRLDRSRVLNSLNLCSNVHVDVKSEIKKMGLGKDILQIEFKGKAQYPVKLSTRFLAREILFLIIVWLNSGKFQNFHFQAEMFIFECNLRF